MKKYLKLIIILIFIGGALYFWHQASSWESLLSNDWSKNPELSNASATLEYLRALTKVVILGFTAILAMQYLKKSENPS